MPYTEGFANAGPSTIVSVGGTTAPAALTQESWTVGAGWAGSSAALTPAPGTRFRVVDPLLPTEIVLITVTSGTAWTAIRGWEGTTPVAHAANWTAFQIVSADVLGWALEGNRDGIMPAGAIAQSFPQIMWNTAAGSSSGIAGKVNMTAVWLQRGSTVTAVNVPVVAASGTLTHYWAGLADSTGLQLAHSADSTSGTLAASTVRTTNLTAPYVTTYTGLHYVLWSVSASTTSPTFITAGYSAFGFTTMPPFLAGVSGTTQAAPGTDGVTSYALPTGPGIVAYTYLT